MTKKETGQLLMLICAIDHRTLGEVDVAVWQPLLDDINFADATNALKTYYKKTDKWIMPFNIREEIRLAESRRVLTPLEQEMKEQAYIARCDAHRIRVTEERTRSRQAAAEAAAIRAQLTGGWTE